MNIRFERNRTSTIVVMYSLYLYFLGLSLRNTSKALIIFKDDKRSHVSIWKWIQRFGSLQIYKRKRVSAFIIDETVIQIGNQHFWLWFCMVARTLGRMLGQSGKHDAIDAHVVFLARERNWPVLTSDPDDLRAYTSDARSRANLRLRRRRASSGARPTSGNASILTPRGADPRTMEPRSVSENSRARMPPIGAS